MTTTSQKLPPMPGFDVPFLMPDGTINPLWYGWLTALAAIVKILRTEV